MYEWARIAKFVKHVQVSETMLELGNTDFTLVAGMRELFDALFEVDNVDMIQL